MTKIVLNAEIILQRIQFYKIVCVFVSESLIFYLFGVWNKSVFQDFGSATVCKGTALALCSIDVRKRGRYQTLDAGEVESNETKCNFPRARDVMPMKVWAEMDVVTEMLGDV